MKMEILPSDRQNFEKLLDDFGSVVSLHEIASAYCQSGGDLYAALKILSDLQSSTSKASSSTSVEELESADTAPSDDSLEKANYIKSKTRKAPAAMGSVSDLIGRDYVRARPSTNKSGKPKPLKLNSDDIPMSEIWDEKDSSDSMAKREILHEDIGVFLSKMLGDGFGLERSVIQDIVGQCGYDVKKSMDALLALSASTFKKSDDILELASEINYVDLECEQKDDQFLDTGSSGSSTSTHKNKHTLQYPNEKEKYGICKDEISEKERNDVRPVTQVWRHKTFDQLVEEPQKETTIKHGSVKKNLSKFSDGKDVSDLQKEILGALFTVPGRSEKEPEKRRKEVRLPSAFGHPVKEPLKETTLELRPVITRKETTKNDNEDNGDDFEVLRKNVMEYWFTMKEYYKAAVDAFLKEDHRRAQKLLKEGHFFMEKAREADEKSTQKLLERNDEEEMFIDLQDFEPKEAVRFLKVQLNSLSGISSLNLKLLSGNTDQNIMHRRRKRMIIRFLDGENIRWKEEGDGWTIVIPLAEIDRKKLSFAETER